MLKHLMAGVVLSALLAGTALAQSTPAAPADAAANSPEQCLKSAFELAEKAEAKKLSNEEIDKLEDMLTRMEGHCDAKQFSEAQTLAQQIEKEISAKQ
jgi:hypothetical protein